MSECKTCALLNIALIAIYLNDYVSRWAKCICLYCVNESKMRSWCLTFACIIWFTAQTLYLCCDKWWLATGTYPHTVLPGALSLERYSARIYQKPQPFSSIYELSITYDLYILLAVQEHREIEYSCQKDSFYKSTLSIYEL